MKTPERDNKSWLAELNSAGATQQAALSDLRNILLKSLRKIRNKWSYVDESFLEDVVQDSLIKILEKNDQFQGKSSFQTWAISIAIHIAISKLRLKQWKDISLDEITCKSSASIMNNCSVDDRLDLDNDQSTIIDMMHKIIRAELSEKQRLVLLAELKGMPMVKIAEQLGSNRNAIYKMGHDARKRIKHGLEAAGLGIVEINEAFSSR